MADPTEAGRAAAREAAAVDARDTVYQINIKDMMALTDADIPDMESISKTEIKDAYYTRALAELQRSVFAIASANVSVRINREGNIFIEEENEEMRKATEQILYKLLENAKLSLLEDAIQLAEAQEQANVDPMTGALNRRGLEQFLTKEFAKERREGKKENAGAGVLFFDIDHFKKINDTHGETFGDEVIKTLVNRLQGRARPTDTVGRFGGEEIVVWLFDITEEDFQKVAHDMHEISKSGIIAAPDGTDVSFTTSVGARFLTQDEMTASTDNPNELIAQALNESNQAESRSKEMGRDQVTFYEDLKGNEMHIMKQDEFSGVLRRQKGYDRQIGDLTKEIELTTDSRTKRVRQFLLKGLQNSIDDEITREYLLYLLRVQELHHERTEEIKRVADQLTQSDQLAMEVAKLAEVMTELKQQGAILEDILRETPLPKIEPDGDLK